VDLLGNRLLLSQESAWLQRGALSASIAVKEFLALLKCERTNVPVSELANFEREIRESFEQQPVQSNGHVFFVDAAHFV
jgi:FAD/FMN-containing dehydrogenase